MLVDMIEEVPEAPQHRDLAGQTDSPTVEDRLRALERALLPKKLPREVGLEEKLPILAMRYVHRTDVEAKIALNMIKPYAEELAKKSGEYNIANITGAVLNGAWVLYIGYTVRTEEDRDIIEHLGSSYKDIEGIEKDFAGYMLIETTHVLHTAHIWQAFIMPKYMGTNILKLGMKWLEKELKEQGLKNMTMASSLKGWHDKGAELGFEERHTVTTYKKGF